MKLNAIFIKNLGLCLITGAFLLGCSKEEVDNTPKPFTDPRDGNVYKTVRIGNQVWMSENLRYLPGVVGPNIESKTAPYYYVYDYNGTDINAAKASSNYLAYGALYNYTAALNACPAGWHLPTDDEWTVLQKHLIESGFNYDGTTIENRIAKAMATSTGWLSDNTEGAVGNSDFPSKQNASGFSALPCGFRRYTNEFLHVKMVGNWWSATPDTSNDAWIRLLANNLTSILRISGAREIGICVRCIQNQ